MSGKTKLNELEATAICGNDITYITIQGSFGPELINELSVKWKIPQNYMFISSFGKDFHYQISELGGVRLII
jgi:hypothetical protein